MNNNFIKKSKKTLKDFNLDLVAKDNNIFLAVAKGVVFASLELTDDLTQIKNIFVHCKFRGKGIANALLDEIENKLKRKMLIPNEYNYDFYRMLLRRDPLLVTESLHRYREQLFRLKNIRCIIAEVKNNTVLIEKNGVLIELTRHDLISLNWIMIQ